VAGFTFLLHGVQKMLGLLGGNPVERFSLLWVAGLLELFGGLLICGGLFTRPIAFLLAGQMAVAYFRSHAPRGFWPVVNGGDLAVLYCFVFLYISVAGPGPLSLDRVVRGKTA
jgi:putative oxidoreductase